MLLHWLHGKSLLALVFLKALKSEKFLEPYLVTIFQ
jgi:hypothetical protein